MATNPLPIGHQLPWYNHPEFVAAREKVIPPNGRTTYVEPRPVGYTPTDVTEFQYGQRHWSKHQMPEILYQLHRSPQWMQFKLSALPAQKTDSQGNLIFEPFPEPGRRPRPLLDFEILPDQIGGQEHWFILEAWRRLDPRVRWSDIDMRIERNLSKPSLDVLRSRVSRHRASFYMLSWWLSPSASSNLRVLDELSPQQRRNNTTRGSTPGLVDPAQGSNSDRIPYP